MIALETLYLFFSCLLVTLLEVFPICQNALWPIKQYCSVNRLHDQILHKDENLYK